MRTVLAVAGVYNILWGIFAVCFPHAIFHWAKMAPPNYPELWQCVGMIVGVYGLGYAIAALDPLRHWPIVLVGLLGKVFGPIGFLQAYLGGRLPLRFGSLLIFNDLIWWIPFSLILLAAWRSWGHQRRSAMPEVLHFALHARTQDNHSLEELSFRAPLMLIFLRHHGCPFCRETLADISKQRDRIEAEGVQVAFVHMGDENQGRTLLSKYGLADLPRVSDPSQVLYRAFGLAPGGLNQVFGPGVWYRGFEAMVLERHGVGRVIGDTFQMPGVFLLFHGEVLDSYRHQSVADRPDYAELAHRAAAP